MLKYRSQSAVHFCFFTRLSGRAETYGCLLPSPDKWGPDICNPTRNPFVKMWVKAEPWRTPQDMKTNEQREL